MKTCNNCGSENRATARFCANCGRSLAGELTGVEQTDDILETSASEATSQHEDSPPSKNEESTAMSFAPPELEARLEEAVSISESPALEGKPLLERYQLTRVIREDKAGTLYEAEDLLCCWNCKSLQSEAGLEFCENCGASLDRKLLVHIHKQLAEEPINTSEDIFVFEESLYRVIREQKDQNSELEKRGIQLFAGYQSEAGQEREINEDSLLVLQVGGMSETRAEFALGFYAIADGIGGHEAGEIASRTAIRSLAASVMQNVFVPEVSIAPISDIDLTSNLKTTVLEANRAVLSVRQSLGIDTNMGCTLTAALIRGTTLLIGNVGDSRTYLMRNGKLAQITQDHSVISTMLAAGVIQPEEKYTHEQRGVIYRSLGDKSELEVDVFPLSLLPGDRLMLCCDGLSDMVPDDIIEEILLERIDPQAACNRLVELANQAGGQDNISVIIINVQPL